MKINFAAAPLLVFALGLAPRDAVAQTQIGVTELARARTLLEISRAQLTAEQFALLSRKLAAAESAYAELITVARAGQAVAAATEGGATAASAKAIATGGRAVLGGVAELLPLLVLVWPATAHAPGVQQDSPDVQAAKSKVEEHLKELAQAARQVEAEREAAVSRIPRPTLDGRLDAAGKGGKLTSTNPEKSIDSLRKNIQEHRQKIDDYLKNPDAFDNEGLLRNVPTPEIRQKIIDGRVKHLEKEIQTFEKNIKDLGGAP